MSKSETTKATSAIAASNAVIDEYIKFIEILKQKYGDDILKQLEGFEGHNLLKYYFDSAYQINKRKNLVYTINKKVPFSLNMDHFLYKIIKHHTFSLFDLLYYDKNLKNKPHDLEDSYKKSIELAEGISNNDGSIAWFSNMKLPTTYIKIDKSSEVQRHYAGIASYLTPKANVDLRRIHLYYDDFNDILGRHDSNSLNQTSSLFTILVIEYLLGINSKVLIINEYDKIKDKIATNKQINENYNNLKIISLFLLDFALYFNKEDKETRFKNTHLPGRYNALCSDFNFEGLESLKQDSDENINTYKHQKVYDINDPKIFSILKYYYLSLWNNKGYCEFLKVNHPELCDSDGPLNEDMLEILTNNVKVIDFFEFWKYCVYSGDADPHSGLC